MKKTSAPSTVWEGINKIKTKLQTQTIQSCSKSSNPSNKILQNQLDHSNNRKTYVLNAGVGSHVAFKVIRESLC